VREHKLQQLGVVSLEGFCERAPTRTRKKKLCQTKKNAFASAVQVVLCIALALRYQRATARTHICKSTSRILKSTRRIKIVKALYNALETHTRTHTHTHTHTHTQHIYTRRMCVDMDSSLYI
jgi:hypothetical protein